MLPDAVPPSLSTPALQMRCYNLLAEKTLFPSPVLGTSQRRKLSRCSFHPALLPKHHNILPITSAEKLALGVL